MKTRYIITSILAAAGLLLASSCQKETVRNHDDLKAPKSLSVEEDYFNLGWEKDTVEVNYTANCYWGIDFLAWTNKVSEAGDTTMVLSPTKWMSTPVQYGMGSNVAEVVVEANARSNKSRTGYIKVFTGDDNICHMIKVVQAGNPDYVPAADLEPMDLVFDFTQNSMNWPTTSQSVGEVVYPLDGNNYTFVFGRCNMAAYLVVHNVGAYLGLPAIPDYKLTKVTVLVSSNNSRARGAKITADTDGNVVVGDDQAWAATPSVEYVYDLKGTDYETMYYLMCTVSGLPIAGLTLHYEP